MNEQSTAQERWFSRWNVDSDLQLLTDKETNMFHTLTRASDM